MAGGSTSPFCHATTRVSGWFRVRSLGKIELSSPPGSRTD